MITRAKLKTLIFGNWHVKMLSLLAAMLIVYFNSITALENRVIVVPLEARLPNDYLPAEPLPTSVRINLRGESEDVVTILSEDIVAFVDLNAYQDAGSYSAAVQIERRGNALNVDPLEITSDPAQISLRMEERVTKVVAVVTDVAGVLARGYELTQVTVTPNVVTVSGPRSAIENLTEISTQRISVSNHSASSSTRAELLTPNTYITFENSTAINVEIEISEVPIVQNIENVMVNIENLRRQFVAEYDAGGATISVRGLISDLATLSEQGVSLSVQAELITAPGTYQLPALPQLPEQLQSLEIVDYQPQTIMLTVSR